jgi:Tol biopolymer transport system component
MDALAGLKAALHGRYDIEREIGAGGMATVYLARDVRHSRPVAVKVLNAELGAVLGVERFLAEIQVTANLQHPNLLPLFDSGEAAGQLFYVMPFVDGESLRARLVREKQLPVEEAVRIAVAAASALHYAHQHNVIHRDLKPENILLQAGQPVIADFGIALAVSKAGGARVTQTGISLGTPQYMSPEQATGDRAIDGRTDIYSLAALTYEMLVGDPPHVASTAQAIFAKVLTERPTSVRATRQSVPKHVAVAIDKALEKLPADRWASAHEFAEAVQGRAMTVSASAEYPSARAGAELSRVRRTLWAVGATATLLTLSAAAFLLGRRSVPADDAVIRASLALPSDARLASFVFVGPPIAISRDGRTVAYPAQAAAGPQLAVRRLDNLKPTLLSSTVAGVFPDFSPDGETLVYFTGAALRRVAVAGGPASLVTEDAVNAGGGASVGRDGTIVIGNASGMMRGLAIIRPGGNKLESFVAPDTARGFLSCILPRVLRDGETVLFTTRTRTGSDGARIGIASLKNATAAVLDLPGITALGMVGDALVYVRSDGMLMAVRVDLAKRRLTGSPVSLEVEVRTHGNGSVEAAMADDGTLVYMTGLSTSRLALVDMRGSARPLVTDTRQFAYPRFSPDGRRVSVSRAEATNDIWLYDVASGTPTRITAESATSDRAEWTGDGKRLVFRSNRSGPNLIWMQPIDRSTPAQLLAESPYGMPEGILTRDGKILVGRVQRGVTEMDVVRVSMDSARTMSPVAESRFSEYMPALSPNDKWIAYVSNDAGVMDIYVQPLMSTTGRVPVSFGGGSEPRWSPDGRTIYYRANRRVIGASLDFTAGIAVTRRDTLFDDRFMSDAFHQSWDVAPDGRHFLMLDPVDNNREVVVIRNWAREVREKMRGR